MAALIVNSSASFHAGTQQPPPPPPRGHQHHRCGAARRDACCPPLNGRGGVLLRVESKARHVVQARATSSTGSSSSSSSSDVSTREEDATSVEESAALLKKAAKTRKVPPADVFAALRVLEKANLDPSAFLHTIGGNQSPGRTWMLIFTSSKQTVSESVRTGGPGGGSYFPVTAVQRFDASAMRIENGIYLGPVGYLTFEGRIAWQKRILSFLFETLNIKIGSLGPFKINIESKEDKGRTPSANKDPFFTWFYADEEIIAGRGRGGGIAFWCRCTRVF